jgi:uncharacterized membrane protein YqhA
MAQEETSKPDDSLFSRALSGSRFIVLLSVVAILLVALSLFLQTALLAVSHIWRAWSSVLQGSAGTSDLSVTFLELVHVMLEAVVFYLTGVGFYSLFIAPLNIAVALGIETLGDLEEKLISTIIAIMAVTFLEHFIEWKEPMETLQFGGAMALALIPLVLFQRASQRGRRERKETSPNVQSRAARDLFEGGQDEHQIHEDETRAQRPAD